MSTPAQQVTQVANPFNAPVVAAPTGASAGALAQRESSEAQLALVMARNYPRDERASMARILNACARPSLAEDALYEYARGGTNITGPSIRLAEEIARQWGNMTCGVSELSRYGGQSEVLAYAYDQQTGFRDEKRFTVRHWRDTKQGGKAVTDERDIYELIANMGARRKRACILAVIPADVVEAAVKQIELTQREGMGEITPDQVKAMLESFKAFGVTKEMIEKRLQRNIDAITPVLMLGLRKIFASLKDGMSDASEWFEVAPAPAAAEGGAPGPAPAPTTGAERAAQSAKEKKAAAPAAPAAAAAAQATEAVPIYTTVTAISHIREQTTIKACKAAYATVCKDFKDTNRDLPVDIEAVFHEKVEALEAGDL